MLSRGCPSLIFGVAACLGLGGLAAQSVVLLIFALGCTAAAALSAGCANRVPGSVIASAALVLFAVALAAAFDLVVTPGLGAVPFAAWAVVHGMSAHRNHARSR